ncbi:hypothetical protein SynSYN20_01008 [Synechococcus sp. SYN20]|nr:hypothetical protein SynSYN20_01008 [Synechococcus sp. SYN20]
MLEPMLFAAAGAQRTHKKTAPFRGQFMQRVKTKRKQL